MTALFQALTPMRTQVRKLTLYPITCTVCQVCKYKKQEPGTLMYALQAVPQPNDVEQGSPLILAEFVAAQDQEQARHQYATIANETDSEIHTQVINTLLDNRPLTEQCRVSCQYHSWHVFFILWTIQFWWYTPDNTEYSPNETGPLLAPYSR